MQTRLGVIEEKMKSAVEGEISEIAKKLSPKNEFAGCFGIINAAIEPLIFSEENPYILGTETRVGLTASEYSRFSMKLRGKNYEYVIDWHYHPIHIPQLSEDDFLGLADRYLSIANTGVMYYGLIASRKWDGKLVYDWFPIPKSSEIAIALKSPDLHMWLKEKYLKPL